MKKKYIVIITIISLLIIISITCLFAHSKNITNSNTINKQKHKIVNLGLEGNNKSIAYVPLDDRPVNTKRVQYLAESLGYDLRMPPEGTYNTYLKNMEEDVNKNHYGSPQAIAAWLDEMEDNGCNYYIISLDQFFSGGLIGSRYLKDEDFEEYDSSYDEKYQYKNIKNIFEKIINDSTNKVYLFDSVMRLAGSADILDPTEKVFLTNNDAIDIGVFSGIERKELSGDELTIENIVSNYMKDKNGDDIIFSRTNGTYRFKDQWANGYVIDRYINARERKLRLYEYYLNFIKNKENVFITISIDDSSSIENSIQGNDIRYIRKISNLENIRDGIDEQGMAMLAKLAMDKANKSINVSVKYFGGDKEKKSGLSSYSYESNFNNLLNGYNINKVENSPDIDILIYITPKYDDSIESRLLELTTANSLINQYKKNISNHVPTIIIDSIENENNFLQNQLREKVPLGYLMGYSRWNNFSNSSGLALSQGLSRYLYLISNDKNNQTSADEGYIKSLTFSLLKDTGYITNLRKTYSDISNVDLESDLNIHKEAIINNLVENSNYISNLEEYEEKSISDITISNYSFPWNRAFEISFDVEDNITEKNKSMVKFDSNDGNNLLELKMVKNNDKINIQNDVFIKPDNQILSWNTKSDGTGETYSGEVTVNNDLDLYAQWEITKYNIVFHSNNGQDETKTQEMVYGEEKELDENTFTNGIYTFLRWCKQKNAMGDCYSNKQKVTNLTNKNGDKIDLYAIWDKHNLTYNSNGGTGNMEKQEAALGVGIKIKENSFTKTGYKFKEWNPRADGSGTAYKIGESYTFASNLTLYAIWQPIKYNIVFHSNNGQDETKTQEMTYDEEKEFDENTFTNGMYGFVKWCKQKNAMGDCYSNKQSVINLTNTEGENIDLYAIWDKHSLTYNSNGGTGDMYKQEADLGVGIKIKENSFTKTGYKFKEWNPRADGSGTAYKIGESYTFASNLTLYAIWQPIKYNIVFHSNNGEDQTKTQEMTYGEEKELDENTFTYDTHEFIKWCKDENGTGDCYSNKEKISNIANTEGESIDLYAFWIESKTYIINKYSIDETNKIISNIDVNTTEEEFKNNIELGNNFRVDVEYKTINNKNIIFTGGKTKIYEGQNIYNELINVVAGDVNGDGKVNYLDYVAVYNHIKKTKNPSLDKKILENEFLIAADISKDNKISYLDYVLIYNKIKALKGGSN